MNAKTLLIGFRMSQDQQIQNDNDEIPEGTENDQPEGEDILDPFNPADIDIISQQGVIGQLVSRIERRYHLNATGYICLDPDFQRSENVWSLERKSRLVESVLLGIPLPMFYVSARSDGIWDVVDGIQRLGAFRDFILGESYINSLDSGRGSQPELKGRGYKLVGLEFLTQFNGKQFIDLPGRQQDVLTDCNVQITVIRSGTPDAVRFNVFKRINTGGSPLTQQEIRHALHQGSATNFLKELATDRSFLSTTCGSVKDTRMDARELILRLLSTKILKWEESRASKLNIDTLLTSTMQLLNIIGETPERTRDAIPSFDRTLTLDTLKDFFNKAMERNRLVFGAYAFRKSLPGAQRKTQINKALFEMWGVLLGDLSDQDWSTLYKNRYGLLEDCKILYSTTTDGNINVFDKSISQWSSLTNILKWRYDATKQLIVKYTSGDEIHAHSYSTGEL